MSKAKRKPCTRCGIVPEHADKHYYQVECDSAIRKRIRCTACGNHIAEFKDGLHHECSHCHYTRKIEELTRTLADYQRVTIFSCKKVVA